MTSKFSCDDSFLPDALRLSERAGKTKSGVYGAILLAAGISLSGFGRGPLMEVPNDSAASRWLSKKVISSRVLDDMGDPTHWAAFTTGAPEVVDARADQKATERSQNVAEITFSREHSRDGRQSLRLRMPTRLS